MAASASLADYPDLGQKVYEVIRERIVNIDLPPGSPLQVLELARQMGVSKTPVTDAINRLVAERLVDNLPRRGYYVAKLDVDDLLDLLDARMMIELAAVERGIDLVEPTELVEMRRSLDEMETLLDDEGNCLDLAKWMALGRTFHALIIATSRNRHLADVYDRLGVHLHIARAAHAGDISSKRNPVVLVEHRAILEALGSHDLLALKTAINQHTNARRARLCASRRTIT